MDAAAAKATSSEQAILCEQNPRDDANDGIISNLKAALCWDAEIVGYPRVRGKGFEALNKVIVKANVVPIADTPLIGDFLVSINEDLAPDIRV